MWTDQRAFTDTLGFGAEGLAVLCQLRTQCDPQRHTAQQSACSLMLAASLHLHLRKAKVCKGGVSSSSLCGGWGGGMVRSLCLTTETWRL